MKKTVIVVLLSLVFGSAYADDNYKLPDGRTFTEIAGLLSGKSDEEIKEWFKAENIDRTIRTAFLQWKDSQVIKALEKREQELIADNNNKLKEEQEHIALIKAGETVLKMAKEQDKKSKNKK